jgi:hypothetical protein
MYHGPVEPVSYTMINILLIIISIVMYRVGVDRRVWRQIETNGVLLYTRVDQNIIVITIITSTRAYM